MTRNAIPEARIIPSGKLGIRLEKATQGQGSSTGFQCNVPTVPGSGPLFTLNYRMRKFDMGARIHVRGQNATYSVAAGGGWHIGQISKTETHFLLAASV